MIRHITLFFYITYGNLIFVPQVINIILRTEDMLDSSVERPWNDLKGTSVELPEEVRILGVPYPYEEVSGCTVSVHVMTSSRMGIRTIETAARYSHCVCHSLDESPVDLIGSIGSYSLRLELIRMCKFMQQDSACLEKHFGSIVVSERILDMAGTVEDAHTSSSTAFG
jgi:hypothetical protein